MDNAEQGDLCIVMRYYTFFGDMVSYESFWFFFLFLLIFYILCIVVFMYNRNLYNRIKGFLNFISLSFIKKIIQKISGNKEPSDSLYSINKSVCIKQPA